MDKEVIILPKFAFDNVLRNNKIQSDNVETFKKAAFISIIGTNDKNEHAHYFNENKFNVLNLIFDDVEIQVYDEDKLVGHCFDQIDGLNLIDFIKRNEDKQTFIVHCSAGVSRSGAVGTFINDYFHGNYFDFKLKNPNIQPNGAVLAVLNRLMRENENL